MAATEFLSSPPDPDLSSVSDQSVSSRVGNRSLRVAEKKRKKNEAEDPFVLALKYFSDGRFWPRPVQTQHLKLARSMAVQNWTGSNPTNPGETVILENVCLLSSNFYVTDS